MSLEKLGQPRVRVVGSRRSGDFCGGRSQMFCRRGPECITSPDTPAKVYCWSWVQRKVRIKERARSTPFAKCKVGSTAAFILVSCRCI